MTREEMVKISWKPYMKIEYKTPRMEFPILCMLLAVDFESEVFTVCPIDTEVYEPDNVFMSVQYIFIPRPMPRKIK
jgi:hypothetical protein